MSTHPWQNGDALDDTPNDPFDDLFEPFGLDEDTEQPTTPAEPSRAIPVRSEEARTLTVDSAGPPCPSCGTVNKPTNRHCDTCGARLKGQMAVAPQPMLRTTAGARALVVLAGVVLSVALLALVFNLVSGGDPTEESTTSSTEASNTTQAVGILEPLRVECTSELPSHPCDALIDGDPTTSWNATEGGIDDTITVLFNPAVQITEMWIENLSDEGRFLRNHRIRTIEVQLSDLHQMHIQDLADTNEEHQVVHLGSLRTNRVVIHITRGYPGISHDGLEPFNELAVQNITFFGRVAPGE